MLDNGNTFGVDNNGTQMTVPEGGGPDSPRTLWFRDNRKMLDEKEEAEKEAKVEVCAVAKTYLERFNEERKDRIDDRMKSNRADEQRTQEAGKGLLGDTAWERIISLISFNSGAQQKDTSRLKTLLFQAREADLPIKE